MTVLGKILVFLNLVFALAVGGFLVVDFATREKWREKYMKQRDELVIANASAGAYPETFNKQQLENKTFMQQRDTARAEIADLNVIIKSKDDAHKLALDAADTRVKDALLTMEQYLGEKERLNKENQGLVVVLASRDKRIVELVADVNKFRSAAVSEESARKATQDGLDQPLTRVHELERDVIKLNSPAAKGEIALDRNKPNPPTVYVEGKIDAIDPVATNLVSLSVGSDKGLNRDHTLEVYRLSPPLYLGMIRIVDVTPHTAVGKLERVGTANRTPLRVGDTVSSTLTRK